MRHPIEELRAELVGVVELLEQNAVYILSADEGKARMQQARKLLQKIDAIEGSLLVMGLLGGTGVGKSTLMNGLAGAEIASTSHRRPHSDRVLVYRHTQANPLPPLRVTDFPWVEIEHEGPGAENIVLCDLPDFDSLMGGHRQTVTRFLEQLDLLIWVTSPEKYGDRRFYEFLEQVPKAKTNFWFVLNKADLFFEGVSVGAGYEDMDVAVRRFRQHVQAKGIAEPIVFALSARDALDGHEIEPWNQFGLFREQVFQQRDGKTIAAAKAANVDAEVQQYLSGFRSEVRDLERFEGIIQDGRHELQEEREARSQSVGRMLRAWLLKEPRRMMSESSSNLSDLIGPGHSLALLFHRTRPRENEKEQGPHDQPPGVLTGIPEFVTSVLRQELESIGDRLHHRLLRQGLPAPLRDRLDGLLETEARVKRLEGALARLVEMQAVDAAAPRSLGFRGVQHLTYFGLLAFLLIALGGEPAWRQLVVEFGVRNAFLLFLAMTQTIFSTKGLAALSSYALLNLLFAFRFYRRYVRRAHRRQEKQLERLEAGLKEVWQNELDNLLNEMNQLAASVRATKAALDKLEDGINDEKTTS